LESNLAPVIHVATENRSLVKAPSVNEVTVAAPSELAAVTDVDAITAVPASISSPAQEPVSQSPSAQSCAIPISTPDFDDDSFNPFAPESPRKFESSVLNLNDAEQQEFKRESETSAFNDGTFTGQHSKADIGFGVFDDSGGFGTNDTVVDSKIFDDTAQFGTFENIPFETSFSDTFATTAFSNNPLHDVGQSDPFSSESGFNANFTFSHNPAIENDTDNFVEQFSRTSFAEDFGSLSPPADDVGEQDSVIAAPPTEEV